MTNDILIDLFNQLIVVNNNRIEGYDAAAKDLQGGDLKDLFPVFIATSQKCKTELISEVQKLNGTPTDSIKTTGELSKAWANVKATIATNDRKALLIACENGENLTINAYNEALATHSECVDAPQRILLNAQRAAIKDDLDKVVALRRAVLSREKQLA
jgi:uncharacterized protein (TIGR02284 family)